MKVVILAGGLGTRISEESHLIPKPMIEIGGLPILIHIMKIFAKSGFKDFIILAGYKQQIIKNYFNNMYLYSSNVTFDYSNKNSIEFHGVLEEDWRVSIVDTGLYTMTGGRLIKARDYIGEDDFLLTYGDGLSDVDINNLIQEHNSTGNVVTITAVKDLPRFGILNLKANRVLDFREKDSSDYAWINGGFMVVKSSIYELLDNEKTILENHPFKTLAQENKLGVYKHNGFWQCMDTLRDKETLEKLATDEFVPWLSK